MADSEARASVFMNRRIRNRTSGGVGGRRGWKHPRLLPDRWARQGGIGGSDRRIGSAGRAGREETPRRMAPGGTSRAARGAVPLGIPSAFSAFGGRWSDPEGP